MSEHHVDALEPDWLLEQQAAEITGGPRAPRRSGAPPHDTDAELAVLGAMLESLDACDAAWGAGLRSGHFYSPRNAAIYDAIHQVLAEPAKPDPINVAGKVPAVHGVHPSDLINLFSVHTFHWNAASYARRVVDAATARTVQGHALEVAKAAADGKLDEALRRVVKLTDAIPTDETHGGWGPLDLAPVLAGDAAGPVPDVLAVQGAEPLFYRGRTNLIFGESGAGKTWVALLAVREALAAGHAVVYIDLEDTPEGLISRLRLLGCSNDQLAQHLIYIQPEIAWGPTAQATLAGIIDGRGVALVVLDSTGEAMAADGVKGNDDDDVARWFTACPKYLARRGPAVIIIDHIPKDDQQAPLSPIGSQRKKAAIDGAAYRIDAPKAPSKGHEGLLVATVSKDRHGTRHKGQKAAEVALVPSPAGGIAAGVTAPQKAPTDAEGNFRPTTVMERVSKAIEDTPRMSGRMIESRVSGKAKVVREALRLLIVEQYVGQDPDARGFAYVSLRPFRAADDTAPEPEQEPDWMLDQQAQEREELHAS